MAKYTKQYYTKDQPKAIWKLMKTLNNTYRGILYTREALTHTRILGAKA